MALIVSYSGIRGVVGVDLDAEVAARYGRAFGQLVTRRYASPLIAVGRDTRASGQALQRGAMRGLAGFGRLVDLGVVATPTLQHSLGAMGLQAGLCITASHNPSSWNGLKLFIAPENTVLDGAQMRELRELADRPRADAVERGDPAAEDRHNEAVRAHVDKVCAQVDVSKIRRRGFRVALDSAGGAGDEVTHVLLSELGCTVVEVKSTRESEPVAEQLGYLGRAVVEEGCDLGVAQDLDADRLVLITEDGTAAGEELTLPLVAEHLLRRELDSGVVVVKNVATTRVVDDIVAKAGAVLVETQVGEVNLSRAIAAAIATGHNAFGGEGNGGVIYPPVSLGRDSLVGIALILERLACESGPLSRIAMAMPRYHRRKELSPLRDRRGLHATLDAIAAAFPAAEPSRMDGLRLRFDDGAWLIVRASNTEPVLRLSVESPVAERADELMEQLRSVLVQGA